MKISSNEQLSVDMPARVIAKLRALTKGGSVVYHEGRLAADRRICLHVREIAAAVTKLHGEGKIALRQERLSPKVGEGFSYIAVGC